MPEARHLTGEDYAKLAEYYPVTLFFSLLKKT